MPPRPTPPESRDPMGGMNASMGLSRMGNAASQDGPSGRERVWIEEAREGDRQAFDRLVRAHFHGIYALVHRLVGNHEDAEDLAQEVFIKAYRSLGYYRGEGSFAGWLRRIALHLARDHQRRWGRRPHLGSLEEEQHPAPGPGEGEAGMRELTRRVARALEELPTSLRAALVLRVLEGRDYEEVAEATGVKPGTVRTQVMKARRRLERALRPWLRGDE